MLSNGVSDCWMDIFEIRSATMTSDAITKGISQAVLVRFSVT
jgi:hypothetical protein